MRILITGATCMIGKALCEQLLKRNHEIIAIVRKNSNKKNQLFQSERLTIIESDMEFYGKIAKNITGEIDIAVLLAWNGTRGNGRKDCKIQKENYESNMQILYELQQLGCKRIMAAGSQAEYGPWYSTERLSEEIEGSPNTEYGKYKLKFFREANEYCIKNQIQLIEPRFFSIYGPDDLESTLIISSIKKMLRNETCDFTECEQLWDYLYIDDAIEGLIKIIEGDCQGIINFGYGESHVLKDYIKKIYELTKSKSILNFGTIPYPETGAANLNPDVKKLKKMGWMPKVTFEEGIRKIIRRISEDSFLDMGGFEDMRCMEKKLNLKSE